MITLGGAF